MDASTTSSGNLRVSSEGFRRCVWVRLRTPGPPGIEVIQSSTGSTKMKEEDCCSSTEVLVVPGQPGYVLCQARARIPTPENKSAQTGGPRFGYHLRLVRTSTPICYPAAKHRYGCLHHIEWQFAYSSSSRRKWWELHRPSHTSTSSAGARMWPRRLVLWKI